MENIKIENLKKLYIERFSKKANVQSVVALPRPAEHHWLNEKYDLAVLIVWDDSQRMNTMYHYSKYGYRIQEFHIHSAKLRRIIMRGGSRDIAYRALQGEILVDNQSYFAHLRQQLVEFPVTLREQKLLVEFSLFLRRYLQSKQQIREEHVLDAYSNILEALQHWARLVIIEADVLPDVTVWKQVRSINPGVYKLYEELTYSRETVEQRVKLVLLACEFSVMSKMERCCSLLLRILASRAEAWSIGELINHAELAQLDSDISLLLKNLEKRGLVKEVAFALDDEFSILELRYANRG